MASRSFSLSSISPFGPIFAKELRVTSRRKRSYFLRFIYLAFLLLFLILVWTTTARYAYNSGSAVWRQQQQAQLAEAFFITFAMFCVGAMGLIGPVLTATAVNSERLHRTLHVLVMTPINNWQIVAGKLLSRMLIALTLIGLSLPVLALVRLLGGVEAEQIVGVICLATVTALTGASIGLLFSTIINRGYAVILLSYGLMMFLYLFVPMIIALTANPSMNRIAWFFSTTNPFICAGMLVERTAIQMAEWEWCVGLHLVFSAGLTALSAVLLRRMARRENEGDPVVAPLPEVLPNDETIPLPIADSQLRVQDCETASGIAGTSGRTGAVSDNPVLWRELRRPLMSRNWQRALCTIVCLGLLLITYATLGSENALDEGETQIGYAFVFNGLVMLVVCVLSATAIAQEKEGDTWTLLLTTPMSGRAIIMGKVWGIARKMIWPMALIAGHFLLFTVTRIIPWTVFWLVLWVIVTFNAVWIATGVFFSLRISKVTFAVVLNLMLPIFVYAVVPIVLLIVGQMFDNGGEAMAEMTLYYMPYYYLAEGIDHLTMRTRDYNLDRMYMPGRYSTHINVYDWLVLAFGMGCCYLAVSALIIWRTIAHFDRIVGRCRQKMPALRFA